MTNKKNVTGKNAIEATLTTLLGTPYSINKVTDFVGINEDCTINMDMFRISTSCTDCEVEETTITDENFTFTEGRYVDGREHETMYHYVYLESTSGDWRFKLDVDAEENLAGVKELCTVNHAIQLLKEEILGQKYDPVEIMEKFVVEEKGETELQTNEGTACLEAGKELNGESFFVPVRNATAAFVAYDESHKIVEVMPVKFED